MSKPLKFNLHIVAFYISVLFLGDGLGQHWRAWAMLPLFAVSVCLLLRLMRLFDGVIGEARG